jgi:hypothetical protein
LAVAVLVVLVLAIAALLEATPYLALSLLLEAGAAQALAQPGLQI